MDVPGQDPRERLKLQGLPESRSGLLSSSFGVSIYFHQGNELNGLLVGSYIRLDDIQESSFSVFATLLDDKFLGTELLHIIFTLFSSITMCHTDTEHNFLP